MMSMIERSNGWASGAVEERLDLEEGDHAQQRVEMESVSPRRYSVASPSLTAPSEARTHTPFTSSSAGTCAPGLWRRRSVSDLHSMGKVNSQC